MLDAAAEEEEVHGKKQEGKEEKEVMEKEKEKEREREEVVEAGNGDADERATRAKDGGAAAAAEDPPPVHATQKKKRRPSHIKALPHLVAKAKPLGREVSRRELMMIAEIERNHQERQIHNHDKAATADVAGHGDGHGHGHGNSAALGGAVKRAPSWGKGRLSKLSKSRNVQ